MKNISGRFTKVTETSNSIIVGIFGNLTDENVTHNDVLRIASFYGILTHPDKFGYSSITKSGAEKRAMTEPIHVNNYNGFIEIFK